MCNNRAGGHLCRTGIRQENNDNAPVLSPVLNYKINLPAGTDPLMMLPKLKMIEEEEPQLHIEWNESFKEIHVQVMDLL